MNTQSALDELAGLREDLRLLHDALEQANNLSTAWMEAMYAHRYDRLIDLPVEGCPVGYVKIFGFSHHSHGWVLIDVDGPERTIALYTDLLEGSSDYFAFAPGLRDTIVDAVQSLMSYVMTDFPRIREHAMRMQDRLCMKEVGADDTKAKEVECPDPYQELLHAVVRKFPGETRHQTALRYIREREGCGYSHCADAEDGECKRSI